MTSSPFNWKVPAGRALEAALDRALEQPLGITWHARGLRDGLARLSQETGVAIFLDRRIDPDQELTLQKAPTPLETLLGEIAAAAKAQTSRIGAVIYVGPPETVEQLATVAAFMAVFVTAFALFTDALRDALDPKLRGLE